jgi:2-keto-4-pentenoate hydratase/2-oxohepta-3-ene-1,7-dioic acid hydratase in catechol pathway
MKLAYYSLDGERNWGSVDVAAGTIRKIGGAFEDWAPEATAKGSEIIDLDGSPMKLAEVKLLPPIIPGAEIIGTGINYASWAIPPEGADTCFEFKSTTAIAGMEDTIRFPQIIDEQPKCEYRYEIELGIVIGIGMEEPTSEGIRHILGYTVFNDGCLRGQRPSYVTFDWTGSKCGFQASSAGPWIATRDEFGDGQPDLAMIARTNGVVTTSGRSSGMRLNINELLRELSWRTALSPGDLFFSGTPGYAGIPDGVVGPGDDFEFEIESIGVLRNKVEIRNQMPGLPVGLASLKPSDVKGLMEELRQWDGTDVFYVKQNLEKLQSADPDDTQGWRSASRSYLMSVNTDHWPEGSQSDSIEWWAIDTARRRIYKMSGQDIFATGYFPHRREGGTA